MPPLTETPTAPVSLLELLGRDHGTIMEAFLARAERSRSRSFLHWGESSWTYGQALEEILPLAAWFTRAPLANRPRIATYLPNCPQAMWAWLAAARAGRVLVPINRKHRGALLTDMLDRSSASVLITEAAALPELQVALPDGFCSVVLIDAAAESKHVTLPCAVVPYAEAREDRELPQRETQSNDIACVMFTSGTTGRSKAVRVLNNQYVRGAARLVDGYQLRPDDVFHNWLPLCHLGGQLHMTMTAVICGGAVALQPTFSTSRFWQEIRRYHCSVLCGFASVLHFIWSLPPQSDDKKSSLRVGIFAGIPAELHRPFEERFGMKLGENYGMTEIDPITCPEPGIEPPAGSCGHASPEVELVILDADDRLLGPGMLGEIALRTRAADMLMDGYERDAEATLATFRNLWFHTGDLGVRDEQGFLYFKGRSSHYIRRRGENISTVELADIFMRHPGIEECVAVGVPSEVGEEEVKLVAVSRAQTCVRPEDLLAFARMNMANFMVPRFYEVVPSLPRNELGKIMLGELRTCSSATWDALSHSV